MFGRICAFVLLKKSQLLLLIRDRNYDVGIDRRNSRWNSHGGVKKAITNLDFHTLHISTVLRHAKSGR